MRRMDMQDYWEPVAIIGLALIGLVVALLSGCRSFDGDWRRLFDDARTLPPAGVTPDAPEPQPDTPAVAEDMQLDGFLWEPKADSIRIVIPADVDVTKFTLSTLSPHVYIYGPTPANAHEYVIPGNGQYWYDVAVAANPKKHCSIMVYVNRGSPSPVTGKPSDGWRIMDPRQRVIGDKTTRLQEGQNK